MSHKMNPGFLQQGWPTQGLSATSGTGSLCGRYVADQGGSREQKAEQQTGEQAQCREQKAELQIMQGKRISDIWGGCRAYLASLPKRFASTVLGINISMAGFIVCCKGPSCQIRKVVCDLQRQRD